MNAICNGEVIVICNGKVNNLLEAVTFKPLFRWRQNVAELCLALRGYFATLRKCEKLWCYSILLQKPIFSDKYWIPHLMEQYQIWHTFSGTCGHFWITSGYKLDGSRIQKSPKMLFLALVYLYELQPTLTTNKIKKKVEHNATYDLYYSFQEAQFVKNGKN